MPPPLWYGAWTSVLPGVLPDGMSDGDGRPDMVEERAMSNKVPPEFHAGFVALAGRPNVGKSTLLNKILGEKIAIATPRPQTTRNRIVGVRNLKAAQLALLDTPGPPPPSRRGRSPRRPH